jgi:hypothetical protein
MVRDTRQDQAACFAWKQVRLGFLSLASRLTEAWLAWCTWHHHGGHIDLKLKKDGSMRRVASESSTPTFTFSLYCASRAF